MNYVVTDSNTGKIMAVIDMKGVIGNIVEKMNEKIALVVKEDGCFESAKVINVDNGRDCNVEAVVEVTDENGNVEELNIELIKVEIY
jgi:hypothetical protein